MLHRHLPQGFGRYFEPFLGGGAIYWALEPDRAVLSDINEELINVYMQVRKNPERVAAALRLLPVSKRLFFCLRSQKPRTPLGRAVRFIYLNHTAFNGVYRVNREGDFNVPFGCKPGTRLPDLATLRAAAVRLKTANLAAVHFLDALDSVRSKDLVFCDPPYTVRHDNNGFIRYNEALFSWEDQRRLAQEAERLVRKGAYVIIANAHTRTIRDLYSNGFRTITVIRQSRVSADIHTRSVVKEYVFLGGPHRR